MGSGPLAGIGVLVTRAGSRASEMAAALKGLGAEVHQFSAISIEPFPKPDGLSAALSRIGLYQALLFTSANGAGIFADRVAEADLTPARLPPALCVGPRTAAAWREAGGVVAGVPARFTGEDILSLLPDPRGRAYLLLRPQTAATDVAGLLRAQGAMVDEVVLYRTVVPASAEGNLRDLLAAGRIQVVTAASPSAVAGVLELAGEAEALSRLPWLCIGPKTAEAARRAGMTDVHHPADHTVEAMVEMLPRLMGRG